MWLRFVLIVLFLSDSCKYGITSMECVTTDWRHFSPRTPQVSDESEVFIFQQSFVSFLQLQCFPPWPVSQWCGNMWNCCLTHTRMHAGMHMRTHTHTHTLMYVHMHVYTHMAQHVLHTTLTHAQMATYWGQRWLWKRHFRDSFWAGECW